MSSTSDVVVCARASDSDRLRPLPPRPERAALPRAEARVLGNAKLAAEAEQGHDAQGGPIDRAMVRLRIPLGGKKKD